MLQYLERELKKNNISISYTSELARNDRFYGGIYYVVCLPDEAAFKRTTVEEF